MRLLIDDDSTCSKDRACAQQPDKTHGVMKWAKEGRGRGDIEEEESQCGDLFGCGLCTTATEAKGPPGRGVGAAVWVYGKI